MNSHRAVRRRLHRRFWWYLVLIVLLLVALKGLGFRLLADTAGAALSAAGFVISKLAGPF